MVISTAGNDRTATRQRISSGLSCNVASVDGAVARQGGALSTLARSRRRTNYHYYPLIMILIVVI